MVNGDNCKWSKRIDMNLRFGLRLAIAVLCLEYRMKKYDVWVHAIAIVHEWCDHILHSKWIDHNVKNACAENEIQFRN